MEAIRIGVIGTGVMGERHCRVCANLPQVDLVGITDLDEARGQEVAARYETTYYRDSGQLLPRLRRCSDGQG
jgi:predicted dehydrogenase